MNHDIPNPGNEPFGLPTVTNAQQKYLEMVQLYDSAIREVRTKVEILDAEFRVRYAHNPIHHIDSRLKSPSSIVEKLARKGLPRTLNAAEEHLYDIAGVRIICNYIEDIYRIADLLIRQPAFVIRLHRFLERTLYRCDYLCPQLPVHDQSRSNIGMMPCFFSSR